MPLPKPDTQHENPRGVGKGPLLMPHSKPPHITQPTERRFERKVHSLSRQPVNLAQDEPGGRNRGQLRLKLTPATGVPFPPLGEHMAAVPRLEARDKVLTPEDHKGFGRLFGTLHVHPYNAQKAQAGGPADPQIYLVKTDQSSRYVSGDVWHGDVTCDAGPDPAGGTAGYLGG
jgi:hypothetical protein